MYRWYLGEYWSGESTDDLPITVWAIFSFLCTAAVIAIEQALFMACSVSVVMYSGLDLPTYLQFAWSYPFFLVLNFVVFIKNRKGGEIVKRLNREPVENRRLAFLTGSVAIAFVMGASIVMTVIAPPH